MQGRQKSASGQPTTAVEGRWNWRQHPSDYGRIPIGLAMIPLIYCLAPGPLAHIYTVFNLVPPIWLLANVSGLINQERRPYWSLFPMSMDIVVMSVLAAAVGVFSPIAVVYTSVVAICALNSRVPQGQIAAIFSSLLFGTMLYVRIEYPLLVPEWRDRPPPTAGEAILAWLFLGLVNAVAIFIVRGLVRSREEAALRLKKAMKEISRDLAVARRLQQSLLPQKTPQANGIEVHARYLPLAEVGGDFIDYLEDLEGNLSVLVADAVGHGVSGALLASMTKIAFDGARSSMLQPDAMFASMNEALHSESGLAIAGCYLVISADRRSMRYVVAGSTAPYLLRVNESPRALPGAGPLLGQQATATYTLWSADLHAGDRVALLTSGMHGATEGAAGLSAEQIAAALSGLGEKPAAHWPDVIVASLKRAIEPRQLSDDLSVVVLAV